jgi:sirohydrochlorin cobaltochelatase
MSLPSAIAGRADLAARANTDPMSKDALILFAHGSRDPEWAAPFQRIKGIVERERPHIVVDIAYLEIMSPTLLNAVDHLFQQGVKHITVAPMFLSPGAHVTRDVPQLVEQAKRMYPSITFRLLPSIGKVDALLNAFGSWLASKVRGQLRY